VFRTIRETAATVNLEKAATYNPVAVVLQRHWTAPRLVAFAGAPPGGRVLDLGCGRGMSTIAVARRLAPDEIHAFDVDGDAVDRARRRLTDRVPAVRRVYACDATAIDEPDDSFDAVYESFVIHNIPGWRQVIAEVSRVLKPGGIFYFGEHTRRALERRVVKLLFEHDEAGFFSPEEWIAELNHHGLRVRRCSVRLGGLAMLGVARLDDPSKSRRT
jgi:ubiquinone/menaquinone biosynthesis C-methylase UbiE